MHVFGTLIYDQASTYLQWIPVLRKFHHHMLLRAAFQVSQKIMFEVKYLFQVSIIVGKDKW